MKPSKSPQGLRTLLMAEHDRLNHFFDEMLAAFAADDREETARLWTEFDHRLSAHLELEERWILPRFSDEHPKEARRLLEEHNKIRAQVLEMGVGVDLHLTRLPHVQKLIRSLTDHAKREDQLMYRWTEHLDDDSKRTLRGRLMKGPHSRRQRPAPSLSSGHHP